MRRAFRAVLIVSFLLSACDEAQVRDSTSTQPLVPNSSGLRLLVTPGGLAELYERDRPDGFELAADRRNLWTSEGLEVDAGPFQQFIVPSTFSALPADDAVDWSTSFDTLEVIVPIRITRGADVRICRKALAVDEVGIDARAELVDGESGPAFEVVTTPQVTDDPWTVRDIGACAQGDLPVAFNLEASLIGYLRDAFVTSTTRALETSPLESLGVILGRIEVRRSSAFETNRGSIVLEGRLAEEGARVSPMGLSAELDTALDVNRAACAPPVDLPGVAAGAAGAIDPGEVAGVETDVAFAISEAVLKRTAHAMALSGFACRGFEDASVADLNEDIIATDDLLLEEIGLADLPLGEESRVVFRPGALPELTLRPDRGDLLLTWEEVTVDLYSELFGVPTRIATLETTAEATLEPGAGEPGSVAFRVETIDVRDTTLTSELTSLEDREAIESWTRRTLLLALADLFAFPLPLTPGSGLEVVGTQVRDEDLLVLTRF